MADTIERTVTLDEIAFMVWLKDQGYLMPKPLVGRPGWWAAIMPLVLHFSIQGGRIGDKGGIELRYCYTDDLAEVFEAFEEWDGTGEPKWWHADKVTGRRRWGGNPDLEYHEW